MGLYGFVLYEEGHATIFVGRGHTNAYYTFVGYRGVLFRVGPALFWGGTKGAQQGTTGSFMVGYTTWVYRNIGLWVLARGGRLIARFGTLGVDGIGTRLIRAGPTCGVYAATICVCVTLI